MGGEKSISLDHGREATYEVFGEGEPALFFVGGPGFSSDFIRPDAQLFADRFECFTIDPHGSGGSTPPDHDGHYDHRGHARFYDRVRRALGLDAVSVFGTSFGGTVALTYAALFPESVRRCISVGGFALGEEVDESDAAAEMDRLLARHSEAPWFTEASSVWETWTERVLATDDPAAVESMFASVLPLYCAYPDRTHVRARLDELRPLIKTTLER